MRPSVRFAIWYVPLALAVAVLCAVLGPAKAPAQSTLSAAIPCTGSVIYDASTNGTTKLITAKADGGPIYICGYTIWAAGTATVKLVSGTGTTCGTGTVSLTPAWSLTTQTGINDTSPLFRGIVAQPQQDVCITTSAGVAVQAIVFFGTR